MNNLYYILGLIFAMWVAFFITHRIHQKNSEEEIKKCCNEYEDKIKRLENKLQNSCTDYQSINTKYEILLSTYQNLQSEHTEIIRQKIKAEFRADKLQGELFRARKRSRKLIGSKQK